MIRKSALGAFAFLCLSLSAYGQDVFRAQNFTPVTSGMGTVTFLHKTLAGSCSGSANTCTVTIPSTTANSLLYINAVANDTVYISTSTLPTAGVCSVSWQVPTALEATRSGNQAVSGAFCPKSAGSSTSLTFNWNSSSPGSVANAYVWEFSYTGSTPTVDAESSLTTATATSAPVGVPLTITGPNDLIIQSLATDSGTPSGILTYTHFNGSAFWGSADLENTLSGTAPTWNNSSSSAYCANAIAFH